MQATAPATVIDQDSDLRTHAEMETSAELQQVEIETASISHGFWWWLRLSFCPPLLVIEAVRQRRWRPLLFHLIGWLAFLIYSNYQDPSLLLLRCAAIPIWTAIGGRTNPQPDKAWSDHETGLWALAHLVPLLWIHVAIQRRTLWPYALVLTTTLLSRHGQLLLGLSTDAALPLTLPLIPLAAWIGLRLASRQTAPLPCISGST